MAVPAKRDPGDGKNRCKCCGEAARHMLQNHEVEGLFFTFSAQVTEISKQNFERLTKTAHSTVYKRELISKTLKYKLPLKATKTTRF